MMEGALIAVSAVVIATAVSAYLRRRTEELQQYEICMNTLFESAGTLVKAEETPGVVLDVLEFIVNKANDRHGAREFLFTVWLHRKELSNPGPGMEAIVAFRRSNPALGRIFSRAMAAGLLAMTFKGGFLGTVVRRMVLFDVEQHEDRTQDLAVGFRQVECAQAA